MSTAYGLSEEALVELALQMPDGVSIVSGSKDKQVSIQLLLECVERPTVPDHFNLMGQRLRLCYRRGWEYSNWNGRNRNSVKYRLVLPGEEDE